MSSLLVLTQPIQQILPRLPFVFSEVTKHVSKRLYVHIDPISLGQSSDVNIAYSLKTQIISSIYKMSPKFCPNIDVRILLYGFKYANEETSLSTHEAIERLLIDNSKNNLDLSYIEGRYKSFIQMKSPLYLLNDQDEDPPNETTSPFMSQEIKRYDDVALGGSFDRLHPGHKILLSEAVFLTLNRLTVGIADGPLLAKKVLKELIEPCSLRTSQVRDFLTDIDNRLLYNLVPIEEPLGPTAWDPKIQMLIVSQETLKGVELINNHRQSKGLQKLDYHCIDLVDDICRQHEEEEVKFSSSSSRMRLLGCTLKEYPSLPNEPPVIIGLTGGSTSGKTKIAERLAFLGAGVIDCDKLGHQAYQKDTNCYHKLIQHFGKEIILDNREVDRRALGSIVFQNKDQMLKLNDIVWPEIQKLATIELEKLKVDGKKIIVLDAAVLLEAGWDKVCHGVWVSVIPRAEAIKRITERDRKTEEQAAMRIDSQMSNEDRVKKANVVFSTLWSYEFTQAQVSMAYENLIKLID